MSGFNSLPLRLTFSDILRMLLTNRKILLGIFLIFLVLLSSEATLRIGKFNFNEPFFESDLPLIQREISEGINIYQVDYLLFWKYRPNAIKKEWNISINSLGFRDREFSVKKDADVFRIICLGDSCIGGHALKLQDTFAKQLENLLNHIPGPTHYEVINAGVPGYSSLQGLRYLQIILSKYSPDLFIVHFGYNDKTRARYADKEFSILVFLKSQILRSIISRSRICQYMMKKIYSPHKINWKARVTPEDCRNNLEKMRELVNKNQVKILFIKPCLRQEIINDAEDSVYAPPDPYINLFDLLEPYKDNSQIIYIDYEHPTAYANKIIASEVYSWITSEKSGIMLSVK